MAVNWSSTGQGQVTVGNDVLEYACWGPSPDRAPTLVLLHEGLGCVAQWKDFPERLSKATGFGVFAYSRAGYGGSAPTDLPRPLDFQTREAVDVLAPVMDEAGVQQAVLVGHSDGATIAAIYAGSVSDLRVRGLILIAPHFFTEPTGLAAIARAKDAYLGGDLKTKLTRYHRDPDMAFYGWHDAWTHPDFAQWDVADSIDHWRVPVLAIQGTDDAYGTMAQVAEIETRIYAPLETLILENCGHTPHREFPKQTDAVITEFTARLYRLEQAEVLVA